MNQDEFDFGTDPAPVEAVTARKAGEARALAVEGEPASGHTASAGSVVELTAAPGPRTSVAGIIHTNPTYPTTSRSTARPDARGESGPLGLAPDSVQRLGLGPSLGQQSAVTDPRATEVEGQSLGSGTTPRALRTDWHEASAAEFLSWPHRKQLAYCAARDEVSASEEECEETALWYLERAHGYKEMMV